MFRTPYTLALLVAAASASAAPPPLFVPADPGFHAYMLHDIGACDFNADGNLDLFSVNCFSPPNLMQGDGKGHFTQVRTQMGLDHSPELPGFGEWETPPVFDKPGLYIYAVDRYFYVRAHNAAGLPPLRGALTFICRENVSEAEGVTFNVERQLEKSGLISRTVRFACPENGFLKLKPEPHFIDPLHVVLDTNIPLDRVFMGPARVAPPAHEFDISMLDPHSMAWADLNADDKPDVFVGRGAMLSDPELKPRIDALKDRLLLGTGSGFEDVYDTTGLRKNGCPHRKSCWVDADSDGTLDLFYIGARGAASPLYIRTQMAPMRFEDRAAAFGIDTLPHGGFAWRDFDRDGRMDLAAFQDAQLVVFWGGTSAAPRMARSILLKVDAQPIHVVPGDFNRDGQSDLLFNLQDESILLFTNKGDRTFAQAGLPKLGLPAKALVSAWCDYDNDGLQDLLALPGDLYRQDEAGNFKATGLLADAFPALPAPAVRGWLNCFDMDNDGTRDVLATLRIAGTRIDPFPNYADPFRNEMILLRNTARQNHWLEIVLTGPPGNRPAIGARVVVRSGGHEQAQDIGDSEGSENSQGHYRLYFGLGQAPVADTILIEWPGGARKELSNVKADQILTIRHAG